MTALAPTLQSFFTEYLIGQRGASDHTIGAYRDALRLLLGYVQERIGVRPSYFSLKKSVGRRPVWDRSRLWQAACSRFLAFGRSIRLVRTVSGRSRRDGTAERRDQAALREVGGSLGGAVATGRGDRAATAAGCVASLASMREAIFTEL